MKAAFEKFNSPYKEMRMNCRGVSMDAKGLYPSMTWEGIICSIKETIMRSQMIIENVNWREVGKFNTAKVPQKK